jgi:hypothetical protein
MCYHLSIIQGTQLKSQRGDVTSTRIRNKRPSLVNKALCVPKQYVAVTCVIHCVMHSCNSLQIITCLTCFKRMTELLMEFWNFRFFLPPSPLPCDTQVQCYSMWSVQLLMIAHGWISNCLHLSDFSFVFISWGLNQKYLRCHRHIPTPSVPFHRMVLIASVTFLPNGWRPLFIWVSVTARLSLKVTITFILRWNEIIQSDSKLISGFPWPIIFKPEIII